MITHSSNFLITFEGNCTYLITQRGNSIRIQSQEEHRVVVWLRIIPLHTITYFTVDWHLCTQHMCSMQLVGKMVLKKYYENIIIILMLIV